MAPASASAQARQKSPIQSALASSSELHITIQENERDGQSTEEVTKAAAQARNAASLRLAWVLRAAPHVPIVRGEGRYWYHGRERRARAAGRITQSK